MEGSDRKFAMPDLSEMLVAPIFQLRSASRRTERKSLNWEKMMDFAEGSLCRIQRRWLGDGLDSVVGMGEGNLLTGRSCRPWCRRSRRGQLF
jgi:hypothetical protein